MMRAPVVLTASLCVLLSTRLSAQTVTAGAGEIFCGGGGQPACAQQSAGKVPTAPVVNPKAQAAAAAYAAVQSNLRTNTQLVNTGGNLLLGLIQGMQDTNTPAPPDETEDPAQVQLQHQQQLQLQQQQAALQRNSDAAALLQSANTTLATVNGTASGGAPQLPNAVLNSLLNSGSASPPASANATLNSLLSPSPATPPAVAPASILTQTPSGGATAPSGAADDTPEGALTQLLQTPALIHDALSGLIDSGESLVSGLTNDRFIAWVLADRGTLTTAPLPVATDTPEQMANMAEAQAVVGFNALFKGMLEGPGGFARGLDSYMTKMVNQMGADLGFADANIFGTPE
jgi:hypothetical protein